MRVLQQGLIPAHTVCPFKEDCPEAQNGDCGHAGVEHTVPYSCGYARLFDIFGRGNKENGTN